MGDEADQFKWGVKTGVGQRHKAVIFYDSFTYKSVQYSLYDCAWFYNPGDVETNICKIVRLFETPTHEKKARVVWFFRPGEIRRFLGDVEPKWNELLLASGQGTGLSNVVHLEAVVAKCNVICTSKDTRNPRPSANELQRADYVFYRTFDVSKNSISEKFADEICGIKVELFFNRMKGQRSTNPPSNQAELKKPGEHFDMFSSSRIELNKCEASPSRSGPSKKMSVLKESDKGLYENPKLKGFAVESGTVSCVQVKDKSNVRPFEVSLTENAEDPRPYKKRTILLDDKGSISQKGVSTKRDIFGAEACKIIEKAGAQLVSREGLKTNKQVMEVTRRPDAERRNWFKQLPWEVKLQKAQEAGTLVLLENLDPSFASVEVEDLVYCALEEKVDAKMIQYSSFSNPLYGKAFVIFKSQSAAEKAIYELNRRYLIIADGRPVTGRRRNLRVPSKSTSFPGHLVLDKLKFQMQCEEMRNAVSTSHCSQPNTVEYDLAMQWRELQAKSDLWWNALYEEQRKEINEVKSRLKLNRNALPLSTV
ncbi:protein ANTI-SILENCING 1 [Morus notabilis]|uniref:protein ANTI-SILENCING 1 n=1 Tax=Morus notabilis TaxID=981085 RepID=UPI000CED5E4C|nr:protein ANTI-SILENCING 1 [Morus notabilis]